MLHYCFAVLVSQPQAFRNTISMEQLLHLFRNVFCSAFFLLFSLQSLENVGFGSQLFSLFHSNHGRSPQLLTNNIIQWTGEQKKNKATIPFCIFCYDFFHFNRRAKWKQIKQNEINTVQLWYVIIERVLFSFSAVASVKWPTTNNHPKFLHFLWHSCCAFVQYQNPVKKNVISENGTCFDCDFHYGSHYQYSLAVCCVLVFFSFRLFIRSFSLSFFTTTVWQLKPSGQIDLIISVFLFVTFSNRTFCQRLNP